MKTRSKTVQGTIVTAAILAVPWLFAACEAPTLPAVQEVETGTTDGVPDQVAVAQDSGGDGEVDVYDWRHYWPADGDGAPCPFVSNAAWSPRLAFRAYRWPYYGDLMRWVDLYGVDDPEEVYHRLHDSAIQNDGYSDVAEKWHYLRVTMRRLARSHVTFGVPGRQLSKGRRVPDFEQGWGKEYTLNIPWSRPGEVRSNAERPVAVVSGKDEGDDDEPWYASTAGYEFRGDHNGAAWARIWFYPREGYGRSFGDHPCDQSMSLNPDRRWWFWGKTPPWPT